MRSRSLLLLAGLCLSGLLLVPASASAAVAPVPVQVGLLVINMGNYDPNKGTYLMDFYLWFKWNATSAPVGFTPERFEFMNGRASAREKLYDATDGVTGGREVWFRVQANLYSDPRFENYPYDTQSVEVVFEDAVNTAEQIAYVPLGEGTGLDEGFRVAGWRIDGVETHVSNRTYPFHETYARFRFTVTVSREPTSTTLKAFLPPAAFVVVSGFSFFFHKSKVAQRLTLGTSMLISAVLFHISQIVSLPSLSQLILFDKIMLSVYTFLLASLVVTTLIAVDEDFWKDSDHTREINLYGGLLALGAPIVTFLLLAYV